MAGKREKEFIQKIKAKAKERKHIEGREEARRRYELGKTIAYKNQKKYNRRIKHKKKDFEVF